MRKFNLSTVVIVCMISATLISSAYSALSGSASFSTNGIINYNGHMGLRLLYSTDFETVTRGGTYSLNMGRDINGVAIDQHFQTDGNPSEINWIEGSEKYSGVTPHSGSRSIGMATGGASGYGKRNEFNIFNMQDHLGGSIMGKELYYSVWLFLPSDFSIPTNWFSLGVPMQSQSNNIYPPSDEPYLPISSYGVDSNSGTKYSRVGWGTPGSATDPLTYLAIDFDHIPPLAKWFKVEVYVYFDSSDGTIKVWYDGNLICDKTNIRTLNQADQPMLTTIAKDYHDGSSQLIRIWVDDLEIYGT